MQGRVNPFFLIQFDVYLSPQLAMVKKGWKSFLAKTLEIGMAETIRKHERTGSPMGDGAFIEVLERITGLRVKAGKPGPKPKPMN